MRFFGLFKKSDHPLILDIDSFVYMTNQGPLTTVLGLGEDNEVYLWSYPEGRWLLNAMTPEQRVAMEEEDRKFRDDQVEGMRQKQAKKDARNEKRRLAVQELKKAQKNEKPQ